MSIRQTARSARSSTAPDPEAIVMLREATVSKLSPRAKGCLTYRVGRGDSGMAYIAVSANEGGGYFSREWVSLASVRACLADFLDGAECFPTSLLQAVYANRSVNNACFLVAILRHEGLLIAGDPPSLHRCSGDWASWEQALGAEAVMVDEAVASDDSSIVAGGDSVTVTNTGASSGVEKVVCGDSVTVTDMEAAPDVEMVLAAPKPLKGRRAGRR